MENIMDYSNYVEASYSAVGIVLGLMLVFAVMKLMVIKKKIESKKDEK